MQGAGWDTRPQLLQVEQLPGAVPAVEAGGRIRVGSTLGHNRSARRGGCPAAALSLPCL